MKYTCTSWEPIALGETVAFRSFISREGSEHRVPMLFSLTDARNMTYADFRRMLSAMEANGAVALEQLIKEKRGK